MKIKEILNKYKTFIKYIFSSGISFIIDITLFTIFSKVFKLVIGTYSIILGTILARIISSIINYSLNKNNVFKHNENKKIDINSFVKYIVLVVIQMFVSSFAVFTLYNITKINETLIKVPVECILFLVNYIIQKLFIFNNKKVEISTNLKKVLIIVLSIATSFSLLVKLDINKIVLFTRTDTDFLQYLIFTIAFIIFYNKYLFTIKKHNLFKLLSIIFSLLLIFGYSFDTVDGTGLVYGNSIFILISIIKFISFYTLFNISLNLIYEYSYKLNIGNIKENKIIKFFNKHPFIFSIIVILICYMPYIISYYPAILSPDPVNQIKEFMGIHNRYMESVNLLDSGVTITNFNPVIHTLLLGSCFKIGLNIGNVNLGLFLYSLIQITLMITILSYSIKFLKEEGVPNKILFIILAIYCLVPIFPFYSLSTNKDTIFSLLILLYIIRLYKMIKYDYKIKDVLILILISILLFLMRNNGIYTIFLSLPVALFMFKDKRKMILITLIVITISYFSYNKIILPHYKITQTSIREVLSIPFQQTAALIKYNEDIITEEDKQIIANILDYDIVKSSYNPELSDKVKNSFNKDYTEEDLSNYFHIWFKYLWKKPLTYIDATINNIYGYFYPNTSRWYVYFNYDTRLKEIGYDYHYNSLSSIRNALSDYSSIFQHIPLLSSLVNIGFTVWIYMYLVISLIISRNKKFILILLPALSLILVCIASPANAYFRYALPYIMTLPLVLSLLYVNRKSSK